MGVLTFLAGMVAGIVVLIAWAAFSILFGRYN